ncbi:hypothetical protein [Paraburkholderia sp. A2RI-6]|uniref:hypothetical protein n=1 Tax=Paraburkholderia sp. A2RI-6 TaxID=3028371 RepID=UPI003BA11E4C
MQNLTVLAEQLYLDEFEAACNSAGQPLTLHRNPGCNHGYYFISTFMGDHITYHAQTLYADTSEGSKIIQA